MTNQCPPLIKHGFVRGSYKRITAFCTVNVFVFSLHPVLRKPRNSPERLVATLTSNMAPQLIFGTATFGMDLTEFQDPTSVDNLLSTIKELGINRLDTAARYPPLNPGRSEQLLGEASNLEAEFSIDTKVYTDTRTDGSGDLTREAVARSVKTSLERLGRPQGVRVIYERAGLKTRVLVVHGPWVTCEPSC